MRKQLFTVACVVAGVIAGVSFVLAHVGLMSRI
jgi:hypothetical protein